MRAPWRQLHAGWMMLTGSGAAASIAFGLLVFVSVLASLAIPREGTGLRTWALHRAIAAAPLADRTVVGTVAAGTMAPFSGGEVQATDITGGGAVLRSQLAARGVPVASKPAWSSLLSGSVPVTGAAPTTGRGQPRVEIMYRTNLARYSHIVAGHLPAGGSVIGSRAVVDIAVTPVTAARFGLRVGTRLTVGSRLRLVVTGILKPVRPASVFWTEYSLAARPALTPGTASQPAYWTGTVLVGPGALPLIETRLNLDLMQVSWVYPAALGGLTTGQVSGLQASITGLVSSGASVRVPGTSGPVLVTITSQIPSILTPFIAGERGANPVLELVYVSLAVLGAVVVLLGARLVAERRTADFTLIRARGGALRQLGWLVLRASVVIAAVAGAAAAVLAIALTPGDGDEAGWWLAGSTIAVTVVGPVLITVVRHRVAAPVTGRPVRRAGRRRLAARRIVIETALIALATGGLVVLRNQGLTGGNRALYPSAAPVLVAVPVAVIVLRCYPPLARALGGIAGRSRGVAAFVGLARATRTPPGAGLPAFALVLVLAMVAFPAMISAAVTRGQVSASWQQVGADAVIEAPANQVISPALQREVASVPGAAATATAVVAAGSLPSGFEMPVVFTDPARYAAVVDQAPGARFPLAALSGTVRHGRTASAPGGGAIVPAVATAATTRQVGTAPTSISVEGQSITIRLAGRIHGVPGVAWSTSGVAVAVLPLRALGPNPPEPSLMLVAGSGLDAGRLRAIVSRALPGGSVTARAAALAAIASAPVPRAAQAALAQGIAAAAGFGALVLLLSLLLAARTREMTLARLATMGLRRWQAQLMLAAETLPQVVAAALGGVGCAWLLALLIGPSINPAAFSTAGPGTVVTVAPVPLVVSAAGLVLAALLVLAAQTGVSYRHGSARALRIAD
jgi:putative ABC transport system permease protein